MKIIVPVKRVVDFNVKIRVKSDQSGVETDNVKKSINPFCEIAVEEAIKLKEAGEAEEVIVISIGGEKTDETIRQALAMGADRGIFVKTDDKPEPLAIAKVLKHFVEQENADMVMLGKQAIDGDNNQTGQMLAGLLDWPQGTFSSKIELENGTVNVTREIDGGLQTLALKMPVVLTTDLRLNEPRYASLPNIMKAKKKQLDTIEIGDLAIDTTSRFEILKVTEPSKRESGIKVADVDALIDKLRNEAKVI